MKYHIILISLFLRSSLQASKSAPKIIKSGPSNFPCPITCECFIAKPESRFSGGLAVSCKSDKNSSIPQIHPTVTYLDLSGWNIPTLDANTFRKTKRIEILILKGSHNKRVGIGTFSGMKTLIYLNLYGNELKTIDSGAFSNLYNKFLTIDLGQNPWRCDCALWNNLKSMGDEMSVNWFGVTCTFLPEIFSHYRGAWYEEFQITERWACSKPTVVWLNAIYILCIAVAVIALGYTLLMHIARTIARCCDSNWGAVGLRIRRPVDRFRTEEDSHQIVNDPSNQSKFASGSGPDFGKMLYRIEEIIRKVKVGRDPKSLKKIFCKQFILSEHCAKDDLSYHYFKFMQLLKKEHSDEELKKFADQLHEAIDDEDFKEIIGVLMLKFWSLVYGIVRDKLHSQISRNTPDEGDRGHPESAPETNGIVADSDDDINSIQSLSTDPEQATENRKKDKSKICCGLVAVTKSGEFEKLALLDQLMVALHEAFDPNGCLPEYQKACCACLPLYFIQKIVAVFFGKCFKNSKKCRNCYRKTKPLHSCCCCIGLCLYVIVIVLVPVVLGSLGSFIVILLRS